MPGTPRDAFVHFAQAGCPEDPLYVALCGAIARQPERVALLQAAPAMQRTPTLFFAAVHDRLLEIAGADGVRPELSGWYPSLGGTRLPGPALDAAFDDFLHAEGDAVRQRIATCATQTNEAGRCAVLAPVLRWLAQRTGRTSIALLDVGCSAGLNLGVDHWRYRYLDASANGAPLLAGPDDPRTPLIDCRVLGGPGAVAMQALHATGPAPAITHRLGIDPAPVELHDPAAVRWLRACLWPCDTVRRARLDAAVAVALAHPDVFVVRRVEIDGVIDAIDRWRGTLPPEVLPVVFNSWVLAYFEPPALQVHVAALERRVQDGGLAWVSAEPLQRVARYWPDVPSVAPGPAPDRRVGARDLQESTLWTVALRGAGDRVAYELASRSHAHGRWLQWTAPAA